MTKPKLIICLVLLLCVFQLSYPEQRKFRLSLEDLTDPSSPSYVPCPYPKNNAEVIKDLKYAIKILFSSTENLVLLSPDYSRDILMNLLENKPDYKIYSISKVKSFSIHNGSGYDWLVTVVRKDGTEAAHVVLEDNGLWAGTHSITPPQKLKKPVKEEDVISKVSSILDSPLTRKDIAKIDRVSMPPIIGIRFIPAWEITLKTGMVYYYNTHFEKLFKIKNEIAWKKDSRGTRPNWEDVVSRREVFFLDELNDRVVVFEEVKK